MGRQIRRVPPEWEHPTRKDWPDPSPRFIPLLNGSFDEECDDWYSQAEQWTKGDHPHQIEEKNGSNDQLYRENPHLRPSLHKYYHEYGGSHPGRRSDYMEHFIAGRECTHWQLYEDVSEGTPVGPIFSAREDLIEWMGSCGEFAEWAIEMVRKSGGCVSAVAGL